MSWPFLREAMNAQPFNVEGVSIAAVLATWRQLAWRAKDDGVVFMSAAEIARCTGHAKSTIWAAVAALECAGIIVRLGGARGRRGCYRLTCEQKPDRSATCPPPGQVGGGDKTGGVREADRGCPEGGQGVSGGRTGDVRRADTIYTDRKKERGGLRGFGKVGDVIPWPVTGAPYGHDHGGTETKPPHEPQPGNAEKTMGGNRADFSAALEELRRMAEAPMPRRRR